MATAGYSGTPLTRKLGIKEGFRIRLINQPGNYFLLLKDIPPNVSVVDDVSVKKNMVHYYVKHVNELESTINHLKDQIELNGSIWISWPKKASKVPTDITEDVIRNIALRHGLVDIKVCAVDETWSALKLVIPVKHRVAVR